VDDEDEDNKDAIEEDAVELSIHPIGIVVAVVAAAKNEGI
jgi:hypothetical protein